MDNKVICMDNSNSKNVDARLVDNDRLKYKVMNFLNKKNLKIISLVIIGIVVLIIFLGMTNNNSKEQENTSTSVSRYLTTLEYCAELENKLKAVLSNIDGAGKVSVMISVDGSPELVYATEDDQTLTNNSSGTTSSSNSSSPIIVNVGGSSTALILTENLPAVKGVIVVSSGAGNIGVKLDILNAVSTLLDISADQVSVLKGI